MSIESRPLEVIVNALKLFAQILESIIDIEEARGTRFDEALRELLKPETLLKLSEKLPPELRGELMTALLRLAALASRVQNPLALPTHEKRKVLSELRSIIDSFREGSIKARWVSAWAFPASASLL